MLDMISIFLNFLRFDLWLKMCSYPGECSMCTWEEGVFLCIWMEWPQDIDEMDLIDIFRTFYPNTEEYTFFSSAHGTFSRIDDILGHKPNLSKFKNIEIISSIFSNQNAMRLYINYKKKTVRDTNTWRLNNVFLNTQQVTEEIKKEIKKISRKKWQWKHDNSKPMGCSKSSSKREVYSYIFLPQETRKTSNDNLTLHLKQLEKEEQKDSKIRRRKEIIKIWAEINEKEMKETIVKINKTKADSLRR